MTFTRGQIQGYFDCPVDNLFAVPVMLESLRRLHDDNIVIVSPDAGGVERARAYAKRLNAPLAIVDKRRDKPNQAQAMHVIGDVKGRLAIVVDDMIDTAGTLCAGADVLLKTALPRLWPAPPTLFCLARPLTPSTAPRRFLQVFVTDTIPMGDKLERCPKLEVVSVAALLGKTIHNIHTGSSVSVLFV